jgi:hypothetical protein
MKQLLTKVVELLCGDQISGNGHRGFSMRGIRKMRMEKRISIICVSGTASFL